VSGPERAFDGLGALSAALRARELSPVALVDECLARIDARASLGAFAFVARERAASDARQAEVDLAAGRWRGLLHGVPFAVADLVDTRGIPSALGVSALAGRIPERDATVAARLVEQGAILVGKLAVVPAAGALAAPGTGAGCRTPWPPSGPAGGPSPGAAAAVAAGLVPFAVGVHGAGADPAAARCGVTSLRPTYGVVSRRGVTLASYGLGAVGPVARFAEDCAVVLDAVAGADPRDPTSVAAPAGLGRNGAALRAGLRIGVLELPPAGDGADAFAAAQETFRAAGALVAPATLPELPWVDTAAILEAAEAEVIAGVVLPTAPPRRASGATAADYVRAARLRGEAQRTVARLLERHDLVLAPAPAPASDAPDALSAAVALGGLPAITLPAGLAGGHPVAVRLVGPPLEEARLVSAAAVFQARTSHHLNRPPQVPAVAAVARVVTRP
jgi:aspartyl-tRNA(Asn)/glutamyl-tRNA(Gln) amidotransferase subunit A